MYIGIAISIVVVLAIAYAVTRKRKGGASLPPQGPGNDAEK
jgi:hypothetical protein